MTFPDRYAAFKEGLSDAIGATEALTHVHFGLLIFVAVALLFRRRMHSLWPVSLVWAFALGNEAVDAFASGYEPAHSLFDVLNTAVWPTVLFVVARRRRAAPARHG